MEQFLSLNHDVDPVFDVIKFTFKFSIVKEFLIPLALLFC